MENTPKNSGLRSKRLREGRYSETGRAYLLTSVVNNRRTIFKDWQLGRLLVTELRFAEESGQIKSLAWVIMPDHFHWLVTLESASLGALMQGVKGRSAITINHRLGEQGRLWQKGFHDHALRSEEELEVCARYIVANPLRAGLVEKIGDYSLWDAIWLR